MTRILLCDDESIQRGALRISLQRLPELPLPIGEIKEATHGAQAVEIFKAWQPEIVFLDLRMPVMGGLEAATAILRLAPSTKVIVLTAYDEFSLAQEAIQIGVCDYLLKPANRSDLQRVLQKAMAEIEEERRQKQQLAQLQQRVEAARPLIKQEYINDLLGGSNLSPAALEEKRRFLGLPDHPRAVLLLQLSDFAQVTAGKAEGERQLLKEQLLALLESMLGESAALLHRQSDDRVVLLLPVSLARPGAAGRQVVTELAERIRHNINQQLHLKVVIGIGRTVENPLQLRQSLGDALQAVCYQSPLGSNQVMHIDDVDLGNSSAALPVEEEQVLQGMRLGDQQQAISQLEALLVLLEREEEGSLQTLRWRLVELLVLLTRAAIMGGANPEAATQANIRQLALITHADTLSELRRLVMQAADELLHLVLAERGLRHQRLIKRAVAYLEQHYSQQLSLEDVARVVYLSPFYFSHVFKEQTGMTFVQYLTELRLAAAKQLLRDTHLTIGQIAERVGYNDISYFSRVFKKQVAVTPTDYRHRLTRE
ncbi:MAG: helix-turn-helix domain-containing protein [Bacillota bacterium]|jgi:two-component system response regulator YesN